MSTTYHTFEHFVADRNGRAFQVIAAHGYHRDGTPCKGHLIGDRFTTYGAAVKEANRYQSLNLRGES